MNDDLKTIEHKEFHEMRDFIDKKLMEIIKFSAKKNLVPPTFHLFFLRGLRLYINLTTDILNKKALKDLRVVALLHREKVYFEEIYEQVGKFLDNYTQELEDLTKSQSDQ